MGHGQIPGGTTPAQVRFLTVTEGVVAASQAQAVAAAANPTRRDVVIQNNGPDPVQIHLTTGLAYGAGGTILQLGGMWFASQFNGVVGPGAIYAICATGNTASISVTLES